MHMAIERSKYVYVKNLHIQAPSDSPNTDGIHIQHSRKISIRTSNIRTGNTFFISLHSLINYLLNTILVLLFFSISIHTFKYLKYNPFKS